MLQKFCLRGARQNELKVHLLPGRVRKPELPLSLDSREHKETWKMLRYLEQDRKTPQLNLKVADQVSLHF